VPMGVLLPSERKTRKGRFFLAFVYSLLTLGGLTMVYPFLVMIAASFSGPYDYLSLPLRRRHPTRRT